MPRSAHLASLCTHADARVCVSPRRGNTLLAVIAQDCAAQVGTHLQVAPPLSHFSHAQQGHTISVGLAGDHQRLNASLAVVLVRSWEQHALAQQHSGSAPSGSHKFDGALLAAAAERLQQLQRGVLPAAYCAGLQGAAWPGRSQVRVVSCRVVGCGVVWCGVLVQLCGRRSLCVSAQPKSHCGSCAPDAQMSMACCACSAGAWPVHRWCPTPRSACPAAAPPAG
jgi:hypothetical protein